jgi:hypothetical protein
MSNLDDQAGAFHNQWFFAPQNAKSEMLAVAMSAITTGNPVNATLNPPNAAGSPYTQILRLYLAAS